MNISYDKPLSWETIGTYYDEKGNYYTVNKCSVKKYFLRGWLEVQIWDRGIHKEQKIYDAHESPENIGLYPDKKGHFFYGEDILLSLRTFQNYHEYFKLKPDERPERPRFIDKNKSVMIGSMWQVFVTENLRYFYYDKDENIQNQYSEEFSPLEKKMITINCLRDTESTHASIANYDSWQAFLYARDEYKKGNKMKPENTVLYQFSIVFF